MTETPDHIIFIKQIFSEHFGSIPDNIERFKTGLNHYVYSIEYPDQRYVMRIADEANRATLKGGLYWVKKLADVDVRIPKIIVDGTDDETPFVILDFIPGKDLGDIYSLLSAEEKHEIIRGLVAAQKSLEETLPAHQGYGFLTSYEDHNFKKNWKEVILSHLERSRKRIQENGIFDTKLVDEVTELLGKFDGYFRSIQPFPFLEDTSTKNVLIENGKLSGIIDIDYICFGDKLYIVALTHMALLSMNADTDYTDLWLEELHVSSEQREVFKLYTLIYCLDFMAEIGSRFNSTEAEKIDQGKVERLEKVYTSLREKIAE